MASIQPRIAYFDSEPPAYAPHEDGWYVYTNPQQHTRTDEMTGEEQTYWTADATWQEEEPEH